jgi:hypothetical protein
MNKSMNLGNIELLEFEMVGTIVGLDLNQTL